MKRYYESRPPGPALRTELNDVAPAEVVKRNRERTTKERLAQELDAFAFLTVDHDVYEGELNRDYDPMPYPEAMPTPEADYVGTGIGALYGLGETVTRTWVDPETGEYTEVTRALLADLAGWNVRREA